MWISSGFQVFTTFMTGLKLLEEQPGLRIHKMLCAIGQWVSALAILGMGCWQGFLDLDLGFSGATLWVSPGVSLTRPLLLSIFGFLYKTLFRD